jgi:hypothetical protein
VNKLLYSIIAILAVIIILTRLDNCSPTPNITKSDTTFIVIPPRIEYRTDTVPKYVIRNIIKYDTIIKDGVKVAITPNSYCDSNLKFTAQSSQVFKTGDTLHTSFLFPEKQFTFEFRPTADSIFTITKTNYVTAKQNPFGVVLGVGLVSGIDGIPRLGGFVGIGAKIY